MISFCTPVKGRLEYLRQTYLHNLRAVQTAGIPAEFVLLDYDSPDGLVEWARTELAPFAGLVSFYRLAEPRPCYYIPVADNCALRLARGEIVSNLMADVRVTPHYFREIHELIARDPHRLVRPSREAFSGTTGLLTLWKARFAELGGYDEEMKGWGYQDVDLRHRCEAAKMSLAYWTPSEAQAIPHGDELRIRYAGCSEPVFATNAANKERSRKNVKRKRIVANQGRDWGAAPVERIALV